MVGSPSLGSSAPRAQWSKGGGEVCTTHAVYVTTAWRVPEWETEEGGDWGHLGLIQLRPCQGVSGLLGVATPLLDPPTSLTSSH